MSSQGRYGAQALLESNLPMNCSHEVEWGFRNLTAQVLQEALAINNLL